MRDELRMNILPFWLTHMVDRERGGFYGALTNDLQRRDEVERSLVLCARVLWTFSAAYRRYKDAAYLDMARHANEYLTGKFLDAEYGGMYWGLDREGNPVNDRKQTYGQAFAIYGLSEYFLATGEGSSLDLCRVLFSLIERHAFEPHWGGYIEGCSRNWGQLSDMRLSDKEPFNCPKSMNTMLHVLEGYTNLLHAWPDPRLIAAQTALLHAFLDHIVDPATHTTHLFFDNEWTSLSSNISFGHDIETSWLLMEAAQVLGNADLVDRTRALAVEMAAAVLAQGVDTDGAVMHEGDPGGIINGEKHWWAQAEAVVGFLNVFEFSPEPKFAAATRRAWEFIEDKMVDREHGEWFKVLDREGNPLPGQVKAGPWEDPYHQARACLEVQRRFHV
jgi:mannobiose 2-epimerase